jgi:nitrite reductase (NO-forming)
VTEIEPGVTFNFMTYNGQIPGPMVRVRQGDTVNLTFKNPAENRRPHNVDFHAVYGPGGGAVDTLSPPGETAQISFRAMYPGAFIYHCAVPNMDYHISSGMFGIILVEPPEGLPPVDREFYLGQHEVYTSEAEDDHVAFDFDEMERENPSYVLFNGRKYGLTEDGHGPMTAEVGDTARVFMVTGGPNLTSSFHPIGNVFTEAWREGAIQSTAESNVQTLPVAPGSCGIFHMDFPVPGPVFLVDHALSRVVRKGSKATIQVDGDPQHEVISANPA